MELSELAAYAQDKYHIREEHKWAEFPGFSVLTDPKTGKWAALLMRQWDYETGTELQRCDIKCGKECLAEFQAPYLSGAFRMKGQKWVGVTFDERTDPEVVYKLFDTALHPQEKHGHMIVLESLRGNYSKGPNVNQKVYGDTAIPPKKASTNRGGESVQGRFMSQGGGFVQSRFTSRGGEIEIEGYTPPRVQTQRIGWPEKEIPRRILEMMQLYEYGSSSFEMKCRNFYKQGKFMEDYEDDAPWNGEFSRYFTTYHDLNLHLLRGYFAWRTHVRKGDYRRITTSLAYMYLYELLNGIGSQSPQESFARMKEFEAGYLDTGIGDAAMRENLHKWMKEFAILHGAPKETVVSFMDQALLARDHDLEILRTPQDHTDEEICSALNSLTGGKIEKSPVFTKDPIRGAHLFAAVWRYMSVHCREQNRDLFTACFGKRKSYPWRPLANAVYYEQEKRSDTEYVINACRRYVYSGGAWKEERYDELFFDKYRAHAVVHEADRQLRRYLKVGHYLREKQGEEWIRPFVEAVIRQDQEEIAEAARPKITINLSGLDKIRRDAMITRDSLLTEEETRETAAPLAAFTAAAFETPQTRDVALEEIDKAQTIDTAPAESAFAFTEAPAAPAITALEAPVAASAEAPAAALISTLDALHTQILVSVMRGEPVDALIRNNHLIASVVADTINEAMYDEIGDSVVECDGDDLTLVEDYREDLEFILGGN